MILILAAAEKPEALDSLLSFIGGAIHLVLSDQYVIAEVPEWVDSDVQTAVQKVASFNHWCFVVALNSAKVEVFGPEVEWMLKAKSVAISD